MAYPLVLPVGSAIYLGNASGGGLEAISEHNRAPITISLQGVEKQQRMASGQLRRFYIAKSRTVSLSWSMLPSTSSMTVDGKWGATQIRDLYLASNGHMTIQIKYNNTDSDLFNVFANDASFDLVRRNVKDTVSSSPQEFWNVSLTLEEV